MGKNFKKIKVCLNYFVSIYMGGENVSQSKKKI